MPQTKHHEIHPTAMRNRSLSVLLGLISFSLLFASIPAQAQLPAGTRDAAEQPAQDPLRARADEALDKQDFPTALKILTSLAEKSPTDAHLLYDLAFTQDALDQTSNADDTYRRSIAADDTYFDPHLGLGLLLARTSKLPEARAELLKATTLNTDTPLLKARAFRALARIDQATNPSVASDELLSAMKLSPETPEDILLSGELAEASNDPAAAEAALRRLLAAKPNDPAATAALTHILIHEKKNDEAEALLAATLEKNPDDITLNAQLAGLYEQQDKAAQALPIAQKLHAANPEDSSLTRLLAHLYNRNEQYEQAAPLYATLVAANPRDPTLLDESADVQLHLKNFAEAEALLKRAIAQPSAFPSKEGLGEAAGHLAFAASANNDPATTLQALEIRGRVLPQSPAAIFLAATAHDKLHQTRQASDLYKQFLSVANGKFPDEEWEARHRLITLEHMK